MGSSLRTDPVLGYAVMKTFAFAELMSARLQAARARMMEAWVPASWA
jgi:cytochrome c biogenesis factor